MSENEGIVVPKAEESSSKPTHVYVPPRIDPDLYQADVPDWCPESNVGEEKSHILLTDSGLHSRSVYSEKYDASESVQEFLVTVRNLLDPVCPRTQKFWLRNQTNLPLESDVFALEYLSSYDYDVNKALFSLYCELGSGKDALLTGRSVTVADRTSSNVIFSDCKERILRAPAQSIMGTYPAVLSSVNPRVPFTAGHGEGNTNQSSVGAALLSAGVTSPFSLTYPGSSSPLNTTSTTTGNNNNISARGVQYAVFSSVVSHPRQEELVAKLALENVKHEPSDNSASKPSQQKMSLLNNKNKKEITKNAAAVTSIDDINISTNIDMNMEDNNNNTTSSSSSSMVRTSKPRGASSDKAELRKRWLSIVQRAYIILNQPSLPGGNYNNQHNTNNNSTNKRGSLEEAQKLLDLACQLPLYTPAMSGLGSSVINSSIASNMSNNAVAIAAEEAFLLDNLNLIMGKLTKAVLASRFLISEIRDAIYSCSIDALILTHPNDMKLKSGNKKGNADSLMSGFAELQKELKGQVLVARVEEEQLAEVIVKTTSLLKEVRSIMHECCAWESTSPIAPPVPVISAWTALSLPSNTTRGRPDTYTTEQIKTLLQHHIQLCAADGNHFEATAVRKRPTMEQVAEVIRQAALNPVKITEMTYIEDMHRLGLQQVYMASTILVRATQLAIAKTRLTLDRTRYNLIEVQTLLQRMHTFPFRSIEVDSLQLLYNKAITWRNEVVQLSGGLLLPLNNHTELTTSSTTTDNNTIKLTNNNRSNSRKTDLTTNNKPIPLKKVETLIAEGEHLPFEFKEELEILKEKKLQAKLWLDKLKRSFVPTKVGNTRHKKNITTDENVNNNEKLSLSDMKMMVSEGEMLYQQPMEDDTEYGVGVISNAIAGSGRPPVATSSRTANRELDRAQTVVENAEDWITRVRDLLCGGTTTAEEEELHGNTTAVLTDTIEGSESIDEEDEEDEHEQSIQALRQMLTEAESMPVTLDECGFLRCHLQAMEWAAKVRPLLNNPTTATEANTTTATTINTEERGEDDDKNNTAIENTTRRRSSRQKDLKSAATGVNRTRIPRLPEMQQYAREITKIRASMGNVGSDFPLKPLPEEAACVALVADAEKWLNRLKKVMQGTTVRKGIKLTRLEQLHEEGSRIPINFEHELRPLKATITAAQEWVEEHKTLLSRLGVNVDEENKSTAVNAVEEGTGGADSTHTTTPSAPTSSTDNHNEAESDSMEVTTTAATATATTTEVTLNDLREAALSASQLSADFELSWRTQELLYQIERWVAKVDHMCSVSARAASGSSESDTTSTTTEGPRSTKRKRTSVGENDEAVEEDDVIDDVKAGDFTSSPQGLVSLDELDGLVIQGRNFGLNLEDKVQSLLSVKNHAEAWEREAMQYISTQFAENFKKIFVEYKRIVSDYTASENGAIFPYMTNRKPSALTPANQSKAYKDENILHLKLQALLHEVLEVRAVGERIGVETPFYHTILIFIRLLEWVSEARSIACHQTAARRPVAVDQVTGKTGPKGGRGRGSKSVQFRSWKGWEDLKEPVKYSNWGDIDEELVLVLIQEGSTMLENLYPISTDEKLPGMLTHYSRGLLASAVEYQTREDLMEKEGAEEEEDELGEEDTQEGEGNGEDQDDGDNDSDQEDETGDNNGENASEMTKKRRRATTLAATARKKRILQASSLNTGVEKSTRGASGVSKKRIDSDYVDTVNLLHVHSTTPVEKGKKTKRQRGAAADTTNTTQTTDEKVVDSGRDDVTVESAAVPPVPLDLARTARRAGLDNYFKSENIQQKVRLAPAMAYTLDLWLRALKVYALRLRVANQWVADAHRLLSSLGSAALDDIDSSTSAVVVSASPYKTEGSTSIGSKAHSAEEIEALLNTAVREGIQSKHRTVLEETVQQSKDWLKRAAAIHADNPSTLLTTDELKAFIKAGERVIYKQQRDVEIHSLRNELKQAKQWKTKFDRSGFDTGSASAEQLTELVNESKMIRVNLSEFTDSIVQINKTYCLCRQAYHGEMIGCDTCEEWYHFQCIGLSSNAAEKCAKYMCIRCALKNSFGQSANMVAQLTNKWMNCSEHFRRRDEAYQKIAKKLYKEEKELQKAQTALKSLLESTPPALGAGIPSSSSTQPNEFATTTTTDIPTTNPVVNTTTTTTGTTDNIPLDPMNTTASTVTAAAIGTAFSAVDAEKILITKREVDQLEAVVSKAVQEKEKLGRAIALETQLHKEIFRWMQAMQELMWPCTEEQVVLGRPIGPSANSPLNTTSVLEYNRTLLAQLSSLLPVGMIHMERAATLVGIVNLEDVALVLDAFRWMSWTNICLHMLRHPPTTPALRQLIEVTKNMRCIDEKVIKLLSGVLQRAGNWKSKAKKALSLPQKKPDLARFQALSVEGATHPFTCRMKEKLRNIISSHPSAGMVATTAPETTTSKPSKRGPKPNQLLAADQHTGAGATGAGWSVDTWTARIAASGVDECASSDEEELIVKISHAQESGAEFLPPTVRSPYVQAYAPLNPQNLADMPDLSWPPNLLVPRRRATGAIANAAAASATAPITSSLPSTGGENVSSSSAAPAPSNAGVALPLTSSTVHP